MFVFSEPSVPQDSFTTVPPLLGLGRQIPDIEQFPRVLMFSLPEIDGDDDEAAGTSIPVHPHRHQPSPAHNLHAVVAACAHHTMNQGRTEIASNPITMFIVGRHLLAT